MKERPILFSGPMVRALLEGRKTQTRRKLRIQPQPFSGGVDFSEGFAYWDGGASDCACACPYGVPGDRLWVRESGWERPPLTAKMMREGADTWPPYYYDADGISEQDGADFKAWGFKRRPSIFMPRGASRITLELTDVRIERLHAITYDDAIAEGIAFDKRLDGYGIDGGRFFHCADPRSSYQQLWESINGPSSWDANPWVWVVEFRRAG